MDFDNILMNNIIINQIENDQKNSLINPITDLQDNRKKEITNRLNEILKELLDSKLTNLEKNSKNHFAIINQTSSKIKYITDISMRMSKEIKEKKQKNKHDRLSESTKKINNYEKNKQKSSTINPKTPNRSIKANKNNLKGSLENNIILQRLNTDKKSKSPITISSRHIETEYNILKNPISFRDYHKNLYNKNSVNISSLKKNIPGKQGSTKVIRGKTNILNINPISENFSRQSVISNGTNNTYKTSESSSLIIASKNNNNIRTTKYKKEINSSNKANKKSSVKKSLGIIGRMKKNLEGNSPSKKRITRKINEKIVKSSSIKDNYINSTEYNDSKNSRKVNIKKYSMLAANIKSNHNYSSKKSFESNLNINKENINNLETNLKEEADKLINEDPLLISSLKDLDIGTNASLLNKLSSEEIITNSQKSKEIINYRNDRIFPLRSESSFKIENTFSDENLNNILVFLSIKDILKLKNCSRGFRKSVIDYLIKKCDIERNYFIQKQNELNITINEIPKSISINDLKLTKGALKAINLLNEEILNRIFLEEKPPNNEILIVYKIFFQLIKHQEIIKNESNNNIFWEKCKKYFRNVGGKTGNLLNRIISEKKINIDGDNIYKIYKLTENKIDKIYPSYFSKICGTTGLFVFFIKDILDFLGFSNDKQIKKNSYWSYSKIINLLDSKINILNKYIN